MIGHTTYKTDLHLPLEFFFPLFQNHHLLGVRTQHYPSLPSNRVSEYTLNVTSYKWNCIFRVWSLAILRYARTEEWSVWRLTEGYIVFKDRLCRYSITYMNDGVITLSIREVISKPHKGGGGEEETISNHPTQYQIQFCFCTHASWKSDCYLRVYLCVVEQSGDSIFSVKNLKQAYIIII